MPDMNYGAPQGFPFLFCIQACCVDSHSSLPFCLELYCFFYKSTVQYLLILPGLRPLFTVAFPALPHYLLLPEAMYLMET
jgi:hypothetical protein